MEEHKKTGKLGLTIGYIARAIRFNELKNENLTRIIFLISLIAAFAETYYLNQTTMIENIQNADIVKLIPCFAMMVFSKIVLAVYMLAFIKQLRGKEFKVGDCVSKILGRLPILVMFYTLYYALVTLGCIIIPALWFAVVFIFGSCYIVDMGEGVQSAFEASKNITKGYRKNIFEVCAIFKIVSFLFQFMIWLVFIEANIMVNISIQSFLGAIVSIMMTRLLAMLYVDLEYGLDTTGTKNI